jgi:uncharacterized protein (TIGR00299 family) protein
VRIAYFDCPSGAAGDMILGALVDAGVPFEALQTHLARVPVSGCCLERREVMKGACRSTKVDVSVQSEHGTRHEGIGHPERNLAAIMDVIGASGLPPRVREDARRIFTRLAEAEARVHGTTPDHVHFHDVGAVDAIVDVIGTCIGLHLLGVTTVHCSALPVGGGTVRGPHGRIPVPALGTVELLRGFPVVDTGVRRELLTPTGAAILTTLSTSAGSMPAMTVGSVGYGAGTLTSTRRTWFASSSARPSSGPPPRRSPRWRPPSTTCHPSSTRRSSSGSSRPAPSTCTSRLSS